MKVRFILSLFAALFIAGNMIATEVPAPQYERVRVVLKGEIGRETSRSVPVIPIEAFVDDNMVSIIFSAPLGTVEILVDGKAQETCQVTKEGQEISFSVEELAPGTYTLEFKTPEGGYVYGEFTIE